MMLDRDEGHASAKPNLPCLYREMWLSQILNLSSVLAVDQSKWGVINSDAAGLCWPLLWAGDKKAFLTLLDWNPDVLNHFTSQKLGEKWFVKIPDYSKEVEWTVLLNYSSHSNRSSSHTRCTQKGSWHINKSKHSSRAAPGRGAWGCWWLRERGSLAVGDGFGHVPIDKVFCHIPGPEQMDCKKKVHFLRMDVALERKIPTGIFLCHRCCLVDKAFTMDEAGAPSQSALAGLLRWPEFQILQLFSCYFSTFHSHSMCSKGGSGDLTVWDKVPDGFGDDGWKY